MANLMEKGVLSVRKRTVTHITKNIFWYIIYLLPLLLFIGYIFSCYSNEGFFSWYSEVDGAPYNVDFLVGYFNRFMNAFVMSSNPIYNVFTDLFGRGGMLPIFNSVTVGEGIILYFTYFVGVYLIHLCVDFLLFIPKLCHKWMNSFTSTEDVE